MEERSPERSRRRRRSRWRLVPPLLFLLALVAYWGLGRLEQARTASPLPVGARAGDRLDPRRLMADVRHLASAELAGRRTGTPGNALARAFLVERLRELGVAPLVDDYLHPFAFEHRSIKDTLRGRPDAVREYEGVNVLGFIPGATAAADGDGDGDGEYKTTNPVTDADEGRVTNPDADAPAIVLSAHYDHLGVRDGVVHPGADDNASGVAVLLAVAEALVREPPNRPVVLAFFDAEELGLSGAKAYVNSPPLSLEATALLVNLDMVSRNDAGELFVAGTHHRPELAALVREAAARSPVRVRLGHDRPVWLAGSFQDWTEASDHGPLHGAGVPFLYLGVEDHPDYHRPTDVPERIDPAFFHDVAELVLDLVRLADQRPGIGRP